MSEIIIKAIYISGFISIFFIRRFFTKSQKDSKIKRKLTSGEIYSIILVVISYILTFTYIFSELLESFNFYASFWFKCLGGILYISNLLLFYFSHKQLKTNWTSNLEIKSNHVLITSGIYKYLRHPLYLAYIIMGIAQTMMFANYLAGLPFLISMIVFYLIRKSKEERLMIEHFKDDYVSYRKKTGGIIPNLGGYFKNN